MFIKGRQRLVALWTLVGLLCLVGLQLRLRGAGGDLWLDEIWSFQLLEPINSIGKIFWAINHDNNHFLNSIYLYLIGPDVSPVLARTLSIVLGTATIFVTVLAVRGNGTTMGAAALVFTFSYTLVHYGSEARGYAGLALFTVSSIVLLEQRLDGIRRPILFGAVVLLGFLSHLTMAATVAALVVWTSFVVWRQTRSLASTNAQVGAIFGPAFLAVIPLGLLMLGGRIFYGFNIGGVEPFTLTSFSAGFGGSIKFALGLPLWLNDWGVILAVTLALFVSQKLFPSRRTSLYFIGIFILPVAMAISHMPNVTYPRYFLFSTILLLLWLAEMFGHAIDAKGSPRVVAIVAMTAFVAGNIMSLQSFYHAGRGSYQPIVDQIASSGDRTYSASHDTGVPIVVDFLSRRGGSDAFFVPPEEFCESRPRFFIQQSKDTPLKRIIPSNACDLTYERIESARYWGLSGSNWALYRHRDP